MVEFFYFISVIATAIILFFGGSITMDDKGIERVPPEFRAPFIQSRNRRTVFGFVLYLMAATCVLASVIGYPWVRVWIAHMEGKAELARAENNRRIKITEANATAEASLKLAVADVNRAQGIRQANEIIAGQLGGPENYLRFLSIEALKEVNANASSKIVYVPTEANLPITEATRFQE